VYGVSRFVEGEGFHGHWLDPSAIENAAASWAFVLMVQRKFPKSQFLLNFTTAFYYP